MDVDLTAGIVRILKPDGTTAGTGFVVNDEGLIATCAHVVQAAGGGVGETVRVAFHATGEEREAQVEPEWWRDPDAEDMAILRLEGSLPTGATPVVLGVAVGSAEHPFRAFGYPVIGDIEGLWATGEIKGQIRLSDGRQLLQLASPELDRGISGGPVLDVMRQQVVGMVTAVYYPDATTKHRDTALATLAETLHDACSEIPLVQVPLRELLAGESIWRLAMFDRRAWDIVLARLRAAASARPVWSAMGAFALTVVLLGVFLGARAYLNRGWRAIPGGQVLLGQPDGHCSQPVEPFEIQVTEVTNVDYLKCLRADACAPPNSIWEIGPDGWVYPEDLDQHPVWGLSWEDANGYCQFIGARLPTEAEWVRAARRGSAQSYPWGEEFAVEYANVFESGIGNSMMVTTYPQGRNEDGIYHLSGNVREWVADRATDPCYPPAGEGEHVAKGGSFKDSAESTNLWSRFQSDELPYVGVRCVRDIRS